MSIDIQERKHRHYLLDLDYELYGSVLKKVQEAGFPEIHYDKELQRWYLDKTENPAWEDAITALAKDIPQYCPRVLSLAALPMPQHDGVIPTLSNDKQDPALVDAAMAKILPGKKDAKKEGPDNGKDKGQERGGLTR